MKTMEERIEWIKNASNEDLLKQCVKYNAIDIFEDDLPGGMDWKEFIKVREMLTNAVLARMDK